MSSSPILSRGVPQLALYVTSAMRLQATYQNSAGSTMTATATSSIRENMWTQVRFRNEAYRYDDDLRWEEKNQCPDSMWTIDYRNIDDSGWTPAFEPLDNLGVGKDHNISRCDAPFFVGRAAAGMLGDRSSTMKGWLSDMCVHRGLGPVAACNATNSGIVRRGTSEGIPLHLWNMDQICDALEGAPLEFMNELLAETSDQRLADQAVMLLGQLAHAGPAGRKRMIEKIPQLFDEAWDILQDACSRERDDDTYVLFCAFV